MIRFVIIALTALPTLADTPLSFTPAENASFAFDTGVLKGTLRLNGKSIGLTPVTHIAANTQIAGPYGLFSHYRLLDDQARYGKAAWDWKSQAKPAKDGAVEVIWQADDDHPFSMTALYRLSAANTLDLATTVTATKELKNFEVFLAFYFNGFASSSVFTTVDGKPAFLPATPDNGVWQIFPRDDAAVALINDGRWKRPPHPVEWKLMPRFTAPIAIRRDAKTGLCAVLMSRKQDCFAVATPHGEEPHRSIYFCLFGATLKPNHPLTAHTRLIIQKDLTDAQAIALYEHSIKEQND